MAKVKLYQWPPPVYVAKFAGGEECRMSVSSTTKTGYGFERARRIVCAVIGNERGRALRPRRPGHEIDAEIASKSAEKKGMRWNSKPVSPFYPDMAWVTKNFPPATDIVSGHFEHNGEIIPDPMFAPAAAAVVAAGGSSKPKMTAVEKLIAQIAKLPPEQQAQIALALSF